MQDPHGSKPEVWMLVGLRMRHVAVFAYTKVHETLGVETTANMDARANLEMSENL